MELAYIAEGLHLRNYLYSKQLLLGFSSCGKVMFSQECVIPSVDRGKEGGPSQHAMGQGKYLIKGVSVRWVSAQGGVYLGGSAQGGLPGGLSGGV